MYKGKKTEEKRRGENKNQTKISINVSFLNEYSACEIKVKNREKKIKVRRTEGQQREKERKNKENKTKPRPLIKVQENTQNKIVLGQLSLLESDGFFVGFIVLSKAGPLACCLWRPRLLLFAGTIVFFFLFSFVC